MRPRAPDPYWIPAEPDDPVAEARQDDGQDGQRETREAQDGDPATHQRDAPEPDLLERGARPAADGRSGMVTARDSHGGIHRTRSRAEPASCRDRIWTKWYPVSK